MRIAVMTPAVGSGKPILLACSFYLGYDPKQLRKMKPYPPLATLIAASVLRERGHDVRLFDAMLSQGVEEFSQALDEHRPSVVGILEDNFNFLTKMCTLRMREAAQQMVRAAKARGCAVAVNGSDAIDHPELYLSAGADAVIAAEAEHAFAELADRWSGRAEADLTVIPGLILPPQNGKPGAAPSDDNLHRTASRPFLGDLDALPLPAWDLVDVERYREVWNASHGRLSWNVATARGCPYRCNWCAKPLFGTRYAQRSAAAVAEELRLLQETVAPDHIWFADDIFGLTAQWIEEFSREVIRRGVRIPFMMQSRVNLMTPRVAAALAEAGAEEVWLGVESGADKILRAMEKGTTVAQARAATRTLKTQGIRTGWFIQLGYLGEEWSDILLTRDLIRDEKPDDIGVSVSYPLPGTKFFEMVQDHLGEKRNWRDSDELAMMFHGHYPRPTAPRTSMSDGPNWSGRRGSSVPPSSCDLRPVDDHGAASWTFSEPEKHNVGRRAGVRQYCGCVRRAFRSVGKRRRTEANGPPRVAARVSRGKLFDRVGWRYG
jgi:anaerobic magnesium-protoporphyrin IX monomethyl ester cyclase